MSRSGCRTAWRTGMTVPSLLHVTVLGGVDADRVEVIVTDDAYVTPRHSRSPPPSRNVSGVQRPGESRSSRGDQAPRAEADIVTFQMEFSARPRIDPCRERMDVRGALCVSQRRIRRQGRS